METLLDRGAAIEARNDGGWTALMFASGHGEVVVVETLVDYGAAIEAREDKGATALMVASGRGQAVVVETLLDRGAAIEARSYGGWTALMMASGMGISPYVGQPAGGSGLPVPPPLTDSDSRAAVVETLLDRGAAIDARDWEGNTALDIAYALGNQEVINALRTAGAVR